MSKQFAVIDLGTNTFHLLIVEQDTTSFKEIHRERVFVKLAEEGIETIGAAAYQRGINALTYFKKILDDLSIYKMKVIGTAALRTASNGITFIEEIYHSLGIKIELIDGQREAELIHKGVSLIIAPSIEKHLIMDIGGGSIEFIIANQQGILWAESFPIGVGILYKQFHHSDPITSAEIDDIVAFIHQNIKPLYIALEQFPAKILVGASGTFDVLGKVLAKAPTSSMYDYLDITNFPSFYNQIIKSNLAERHAMQEVPDARADLIIVAMVLIDFILKKIAIEKIVVSPYALKEGVLAELIAMEN